MTQQFDVYLDDIRREDWPLLLAWRNDREIMQHLPSAETTLEWAAHKAFWMCDRGNRIDKMVWITDNSSMGVRPVGIVHCKEDGEVGVVIGEKTSWGRGIADAALRRLLLFLKQRSPIFAVIHPDNKRSVALFSGLGFVAVGEARNGQINYVWEDRSCV